MQGVATRGGGAGGISPPIEYINMIVPPGAAHEEFSILLLFWGF